MGGSGAQTGRLFRCDSGSPIARVGKQRKQYSDKDLVPNVPSSEILFESLLFIYI